MSAPEASHSTSNILEKLGRASMGELLLNIFKDGLGLFIPLKLLGLENLGQRSHDCGKILDKPPIERG